MAIAAVETYTVFVDIHHFLILIFSLLYGVTWLDHLCQHQQAILNLTAQLMSGSAKVEQWTAHVQNVTETMIKKIKRLDQQP